MDPALLERARGLQHDIAGALATMTSCEYTELRPTPPTLSTMTITGTTTLMRVCRASILIALSLVEGESPLTEVKSKPRKRKQSTAFYNQITICHGRKSVKVFNNGSMHITGCTSPTEFVDVASTVCALLGDVAGLESKAGTEGIHLTDFSIQMINLNFAAGTHVYLKRLRDVCTSMGFVASYDADVYPGLNVKLPVDGQRVTVLIFRSGKIIITGAKKSCHLQQAHEIITRVLDDNPEVRVRVNEDMTDTKLPKINICI